MKTTNKSIKYPCVRLRWFSICRFFTFLSHGFACKHTFGYSDLDSHHTSTHTPPCTYTSTPALSLSRMLTFTAHFPILIGYDIIPHHQPISSQLPLLTRLPAIHIKPRDQLLDWLHPTDRQAVFRGVAGLFFFFHFRVLYLTCSPHPDPLPQMDSLREINTSLVFYFERAGANRKQQLFRSPCLPSCSKPNLNMIQKLRNQCYIHSGLKCSLQ